MCAGSFFPAWMQRAGEDSRPEAETSFEVLPCLFQSKPCDVKAPAQGEAIFQPGLGKTKTVMRGDGK